MADIQQKTTDTLQPSITHPDNPEPVQLPNIKGQQEIDLKQSTKDQESKQNNQQNVEGSTNDQKQILLEEKINQNTEEVQQNDKESQEMAEPSQYNKPQQQVQIAMEESKQQITQENNQIKNQESASLPQTPLQQDLNQQANQDISNNHAQPVSQQKKQDQEEASIQQQKPQAKIDETQVKIQQNVPHQNQPVVNVIQTKQQEQQVQLAQNDKQQPSVDIIVTQTNTNQQKIQNNEQTQNKEQEQKDKQEPVNSQLVCQKQQQQKILLKQYAQVPMTYKQSEIHINLTGKLQQNMQLAPSNKQIQSQKPIQLNEKQQQKPQKQMNKPLQIQQEQDERPSAQIKQKLQTQVDKPFQQTGQVEKPLSQIEQKKDEKPSSQTQKLQSKKDEKGIQQQKNQGTTGIDMKYFQTKIDQSLIWKQKGTQMFKAKQFDKAIQFYTQGMKQIDPSSFYGATKQQCQRMAQIAGILLYNIGSCYFSLKRYQQSEVFYNEALTINHKYTKAFYKRALSRYQQNKLEGALTDIKSAYALQKSSQIHDSYVLIAKAYNQQINRNKEAQKALTSKMFGCEKKKEKSQQQEKIQKTSQFNQESRDQGSSWTVPIILGVTALGIFAYQYFKNRH